MFSSFPYLRSLATITWDTLDWYGYDKDGGSVHDVIGTRCDPYTYKLTSNNDYHYCCHSNLTRALVKEKNIKLDDAEKIIHDVLNVFMLTGFTNDTKQYFMKSSPVRPGDYLEFFAETDLLGALSACPGGDCGSEHSSDVAKCYPLKVSIWEVDQKFLNETIVKRDSRRRCFWWKIVYAPRVPPRRRRTSNVRLPLELRSDRHETSATRVSDDLQISIF